MILLQEFHIKKLSILLITIMLCSITIAQSNDSTVTADTNVIIRIDTTSFQFDSISSAPILINKPDSTNSNKDTTKIKIDSLSVTFFEGKIQNLKLNNYHYIDTNTYNYQIFNPLYRNNGMYSTLSNIGLAANNLVYTPTLSSGYYTKLGSFDRYMYHNEKVKYYKLYVPYTELNYVLAAKKEQNFNIVFTRSIFKGFTFGLDYALNFSPSASSPYQRSAANDQRLFITSQYYTNNKRYGVIFNYLHNKIIVEENGGIKYDSVFENSIETDRRVFDVNLYDAENYIKQSGFFVEQYFNILAPKSKKDSIKRKIDPGNISYSFRYKRNRMLYTDGNNDPSFYFNNSQQLDSTSTFDSLTQIQYVNTVKWSNIGYNDNPKDKIFYMFLGASHNYIEYVLPYDSIKNTLSQINTFGGIAFNFGRSFHLSGDVNYVFGDYNQGDYSINALLSQYLGTEFKNFGQLKFGLNFINRTPNWYFNNYQSNFYSWSNNLKKENYLIISGSYNYKQLSAGVKFFTINNYTYLSDSIRPEQIDKSETMMNFFVEGTLPLKKFGINTKIVYQTTSQPNIIRFPDLTAVMDIYFRTTIFKKAGTLQTGFQVTYFSEYYADAYMPELRLFYVQNDKKIGNYPYLDVYITLMVKRARLFVKMSHLNSYLGDYRYYLAPHYPARDARFSFGASWRFHD